MEAPLNYELDNMPHTPSRNEKLDTSSDQGSQSPIYPRHSNNALTSSTVHHKNQKPPTTSSDINISNWEDNINDKTKNSECDSKSTEEAARNWNVRQPKGLPDDSDDSITTKSGTRNVTGTNSKESSDDKSDTNPPWSINQNGLEDSNNNESSNDESSPKKSVGISLKYRRERSKKQRAAMASKKRATETRHYNNIDPKDKDEWSSGNEGSSRDGDHSISNHDDNNITISKKTGNSINSNHPSPKGAALIDDIKRMRNITNNQRNNNFGSNSSTIDSINLDRSVKPSEPSEEDNAGIDDANSISIKANKSIKSSNKIKPSTYLILQRLTNRQNSQKKVSPPQKIEKRLQYLDGDESEQSSSPDSSNPASQRGKNCCWK